MNNNNNSGSHFFNEQVIERLDTVNKEIKMLKSKNNEMVQKMDLLIDFLERKEQSQRSFGCEIKWRFLINTHYPSAPL